MTGEKGLKIEVEVLVFLWVPYGYLKKTADEHLELRRDGSKKKNRWSLRLVKR